MNINAVSANEAVNPFDPSSTGDPTAGAGSSSGSSGTSSSSNVTQDQFLQLLVTQLKNQDPMNPTNSDQFMSELAQFSDLEETIGIHQDLNALLEAEGIQIPTSGSGS